MEKYSRYIVSGIRKIIVMIVIRRSVSVLNIRLFLD